MLAFAAFEGLRCAEIAGLHRKDVVDHLDPPVLIVRDGKGSEQRILPLHPEAWRAAKDYRLTVGSMAGAPRAAGS